MPGKSGRAKANKRKDTSPSPSDSCSLDDAKRERALQEICDMLERAAEKASPKKREATKQSIERLKRMSRGQSMPAPKAITLELLEATPDGYLNRLICDYVHACVFEKPKEYDAALAKLPKGLQYAWHLAGIDYEIPNGGFNQFFTNTSGQHALDTLEALRAVGAREAAEIVKKAIGIFAKKFGRPADSRERWYGEWKEDKEIDSLERRFYKLVNSGATSFVPYVRKHPEQFVHARVIKAKRKRR
jgi:hypothetical protein